MLDIKITRTAAPKAKPTDETKLGFGKKFSDHMFVMDYTEGEGWHDNDDSSWQHKRDPRQPHPKREDKP